MGYFSFMIIAMPMVFMIFNEKIGDSIVDAVIPSVYAAIQLLGATLFTISLLALLLPFCAIAGLIIYNFMIFKPASDAVKLRQAKLKKRDMEGLNYPRIIKKRSAADSTPKDALGRMKALAKYCKRVVIIFKHYVQERIAAPSSRQRAVILAQMQVEQRNWSEMNFPPSYQGHISTVTESDRVRMLSESLSLRSSSSPKVTPRSLTLNKLGLGLGSSKNSNSPKNSPKNSPRSNSPRQMSLSKNISNSGVPKEITNMLVSTNAPKPVVRTNKSALANTTFGHILAAGNEAVIMKKLAEKRSLKKIVPSTLFDSYEFVATLRHRLILSMPLVLEESDDEMEDEGKGAEKDPDLLDVPLGDMTEEFRKLLEIYSPDGVILSLTEQAECMEIFSEWAATQNFHIKVIVTGNVSSEARMISFQLFEDWFNGVLTPTVHRTMDDRVFDKSLRSVPMINKRIKDASLAKPSVVDKIPPATSASRSSKVPSLDMTALQLLQSTTMTDRSDLTPRQRHELTLQRMAANANGNYSSDMYARGPKTISASTLSPPRRPQVPGLNIGGIMGVDSINNTPRLRTPTNRIVEVSYSGPCHSANFTGEAGRVSPFLSTNSSKDSRHNSPRLPTNYYSSRDSQQSPRMPINYYSSKDSHSQNNSPRLPTHFFSDPRDTSPHMSSSASVSVSASATTDSRHTSPVPTPVTVPVPAPVTVPVSSSCGSDPGSGRPPLGNVSSDKDNRPNSTSNSTSNPSSKYPSVTARTNSARLPTHPDRPTVVPMILRGRSPSPMRTDEETCLDEEMGYGGERKDDVSTTTIPFNPNHPPANI